MRRRMHIQMTQPRTSQPWRGGSLLVPTAAQLELSSSPSTALPTGWFFAGQRSDGDATRQEVRSTHCLLLSPEEWHGTKYGSNAVRLHRHPYIDAPQRSVSIEHHLSCIFPAHPRSLASVLIPRPAARRVSASACAALRVSAFRKSLCKERKTFSEPSEKDTAWRLGAGHLASLRAGVSRGQSGKYKQEK